ncbi:hypothetical protein EON83_22445 [bacterium]|nr:MAG: hypothetical protein EON83_22445 [bacterium]
MREALLRRNITIIAIVSVVLAGLITLIMKLRFFDTVNADLTAATAAYEANKTEGGNLEKNLKNQRIAENNLIFAKEQTNVFRQRFRSLSFNLDTTTGNGPREATWRRYLNEYYSDYGVDLRRVLIQAADESGVILATSVKIQAPPQNPEEVVSPAGGFLKPLSDASASMQVSGTLPNILRFFERLNQSEILMTTGSTGATGVRIESGALGARATFNMTPYLVASGPNALLPAASTTTAPAPGAGGPGSGLTPGPAGNSAVNNTAVG